MIRVPCCGAATCRCEVLAAIGAPLAVDKPLADLASRFLVKANAARFEMHSAVRGYVTAQTTDAEQADLARRFTDYYRGQARTVFLQGLAHDEPSYGLLYLESFPHYFAAADRHIAFVDDLIARLADNGFRLARGDKILGSDQARLCHTARLPIHCLVSALGADHKRSPGLLTRRDACFPSRSCDGGP